MPANTFQTLHIRILLNPVPVFGDTTPRLILRHIRRYESMHDTQNPLSFRRWKILFASVLSFFSVGATFFAVPPLIPELIRRFDLGHMEIGILMGAIAIPAVLLSIPLGAAVDRLPTRRSGEVALGIMLTGAVIFALAPQYFLLLLGRLLFGLGGLLMNLLLARALSKAFFGKELGLAMGIFMAVYPAAMILVFLSHGFLFELLGWRGELLGLAGLVLISLPVFHWALPQDQPEEEGKKSTLELRSITPSLLALSLSWFFFFAAFAAVPTFAPEWIGGDHALLTVTLIMWVSLIASPLLGGLIGTVGRTLPFLRAGFFMMAGILVVMALGKLPPTPAMLLIGICVALVPTATYALPVRLVSPESLGLAFGVMTACSNLGTLLGPAVAGSLRDYSGNWVLTWACLGIFAFAGFLLTLLVRENPSGKRDPSS